jgi:hypothetical protein
LNNILREAVERQKKLLIQKLIFQGVYKKDDKHLFELTLSELLEEYRFFKKMEMGNDKNKSLLPTKKSYHI